MSYAHSKESRILVNERHSSAYVTGWAVEHRRVLSRVTTILDDGDRYLPGQLSGTVVVRGLFDPTAGSLYQEASAAQGVDNDFLTTVLPNTPAVGSIALIAVSDIGTFTVDTQVAEAVSLEVQAQPDDGVDMGVLLHVLGAETADSNGAGVDNAASSANGGVGSLHLTAYSGLTSIVVKIQHSTDDSTYADLVTFTTATGTTWERKTVTGTVNRYVRALWDVTGTGTATFAVAFARR